MNHWLTILTVVPFLGGIIVAGLGAERKNLVRILALATSLIGLGGYVLGGAAVRFFFHLAQGF